jgi:hypothetical protein
MDTDYRRDLEDIRDRLDWAGAGIDLLDTIKDRLDKIEEDQNFLLNAINKTADAFNNLADAYNKSVDAYNKLADGLPAALAKAVDELTRPQTPSRRH